jgi:hypothetical protein
VGPAGLIEFGFCGGAAVVIGLGRAGGGETGTEGGTGATGTRWVVEGGGDNIEIGTRIDDEAAAPGPAAVDAALAAVGTTRRDPRAAESAEMTGVEARGVPDAGGATGVRACCTVCTCAPVRAPTVAAGLGVTAPRIGVD